MNDRTAIALSFRKELRECRACDLHVGTTPIPWSGDVSPRYAVLGEAPGRSEAQAGVPFIGPAGQRLKHILKTVGIDPTKVTWLNSANCWPQSVQTPQPDHLKACRPWLHGQLEFIRPQVLITVGVTAFTAIREGQRWPTLQNLHGKPLHHPMYGFKVWPTYHPAAILRGSKKYEGIITEDLKGLAEWDGCALEVCYVCGEELEGWDSNWGIGLCERHLARQSSLFSDDVGIRGKI